MHLTTFFVTYCCHIQKEEIEKLISLIDVNELYCSYRRTHSNLFRLFELSILPFVCVYYLTYIANYDEQIANDQVE